LRKELKLVGYEINIKRLERRSAENCTPSALLWGDSGSTLSGVTVTRENVLSIPAVWSAVRTVSETLASLPFALYEKTEDGSKKAKDHPCYYVTKEECAPNVSGYIFRRAMFADACLGDALAKITRNGVGRPVRFDKIPAGAWELLATPGGMGWAYRVYMADALGNYTKSEILLPSEVLHIRGLSMNTFCGADVAQVHKETFGLSKGAINYGAAFFGNGAHTDKFIKYPGTLTPDQRTMLERKIGQKYGGLGNVGKIMALDQGMELVSVGLDPQQATLNDTRQFQVRETARIFGVPLHLFQDLGDATFNNVETMSTQFVTLCLRPWAVQTEQEYKIKTLTYTEKQSGQFFYRFNLDGLMRGDTAARAAYYNTLFNIGAMSSNDVRDMENMNKRAGGDEYFTPLNMEGSQHKELQQPQTQQGQTGTDTNTQGDGKTDSVPSAAK
jgi:HK97 family phage portal protein